MIFSITPFFHDSTAQEACRLCASYLPVCVWVCWWYRRSSQSHSFIHSLSYDLQRVQSGGCQQLVERSRTAKRNCKRKARFVFDSKTVLTHTGVRPTHYWWITSIRNVSFLLKTLFLLFFFFLFPCPHPVFISQFKGLMSSHCQEHEQTTHTSLNQELLRGF